RRRCGSPRPARCLRKQTRWDEWSYADSCQLLQCRLGRRGRLRRINEQPVPPFETQQRPDEESVVAAALEMIAQYPLYGIRPEKATLKEGTFQQQRFDIGPVLAPIPAFLGRGKALLAPGEGLIGHQAPDGLFQHPLG